VRDEIEPTATGGPGVDHGSDQTIGGLRVDAWASLVVS
jgi:hypothetical protein